MRIPCSQISTLGAVYVCFYKKLSQSAVLTDWESLGCYAFASRVVASVFLAARRYSTLAAVLYLL